MMVRWMEYGDGGGYRVTNRGSKEVMMGILALDIKLRIHQKMA